MYAAGRVLGPVPGVVPPRGCCPVLCGGNLLCSGRGLLWGSVGRVLGYPGMLSPRGAFKELIALFGMAVFPVSNLPGTQRQVKNLHALACRDHSAENEGNFFNIHCAQSHRLSMWCLSCCSASMQCLGYIDVIFFSVLYCRVWCGSEQLLPKGALRTWKLLWPCVAKPGLSLVVVIYM